MKIYYSEQFVENVQQLPSKKILPGPESTITTLINHNNLVYNYYEGSDEDAYDIEYL